MPRSRSTMPLVAMALVTAGCGGSDTTSVPAASGRAQQKPANVIKMMAAALKHVRSYHYEGTLGTANGSVHISVDAARNGNVRATMKTPNGSADILVAPPAAYIRADAGFWRANGYLSTADNLGTHWVKAPRETAAGVIRAIEGVTPRHLATCARRVRRLKLGGTTTVAGKDAMIIVERQGPGNAPTAVYVPLHGRPLPLRMVTSHPPAAGRRSLCSPIEEGFTSQDITFSRYNGDIKVEPPDGAIVIG